MVSESRSMEAVVGQDRALHVDHRATCVHEFLNDHPLSIGIDFCGLSRAVGAVVARNGIRRDRPTGRASRTTDAVSNAPHLLLYRPNTDR